MRYEWIWDNKKGYVKKRKYELIDIFKGIAMLFVAKKVINLATDAAKAIANNYFRDMTNEQIADKITDGFKKIEAYANLAFDVAKIAGYIADNLNYGIRNIKFEVDPEKVKTLTSVIKNINEVAVKNPDTKETIAMLTEVIDFSIEYGALDGEHNG